MNRILSFLLIAIFSIFLGSQITEGILLVPHWKTLSAVEFYDYYAKFGPTIITFYTKLTIIAVLIPVAVSIYCFFKKSPALKYSIISTFFALLVIAFSFAYFKETNQQFFEAAFSDNELKTVLKTWEYWHWLRVLIELIALFFLMLTLNILSKERK